MLSLRLKRTGRKGYAQYRLVAQDSRLSPMSGKVTAYLGSYDPHSKAATIDKEKIDHYLKNGAQPSIRVVSLLTKEGVKLPKWVVQATKKQKAIRHPEKLRKNQPKQEPKAEEAAPAVAEEKTVEAEKAPEEPAEAKSEPEKTEDPKTEADQSEEKEAEPTKPAA